LKAVIGVRREDKNLWERRAPLTPDQVECLIRAHGIEVCVQPSEQRIFADDAYRRAGAKVEEDLSRCQTVLAIKEIPLHFYQERQTYLFFSHTVKGQARNMPILKRMMAKRCQLIDYERIVDDQGRRLVLFGRHAGLAGMIETLVAFGQRLAAEGIETPFARLRQPYQHADLDEAKAHLREVGRSIAAEGLPEAVVPCVIGILGYGNVARGVREILHCLPVEEVEPRMLSRLPRSNRLLYAVVFREEDTVEPIDPSSPFSLPDYFRNPERYRAIVSHHLPYCTVVVNAVYWEKRFPRLVTREDMENLYRRQKTPALRVIGDITCDVEGAVEITRKATTPGDPCFTYDTAIDRIVDGVRALPGPVVMAVDNLPCEFPAESSRDFGLALLPFLPAIAQADFTRPFEAIELPEPIRRAALLHQGTLTPRYRYLERYF
jgi:saccharopine dehydrogenase (NAD+, L-lysine-forming)